MKNIIIILFCNLIFSQEKMIILTNTGISLSDVNIYLDESFYAKTEHDGYFFVKKNINFNKIGNVVKNSW